MAIKTFTKSGRAISGVSRPGIATSPLGKLDPATGKVWQHPRLKLDPISGSSVRVTNPKATSVRSQNGMTASIGMGGKGQRGRTRDVGATKARGEA